MAKLQENPKLFSWSLLAAVAIGTTILISAIGWKVNENLTLRELRSYEYLARIGRLSSIELSQFFAQIERSLMLNENPVVGLSQLGLVAQPTARTDVLKMSPGEVLVLRVGRLARFEARLPDGKFVRASNLGLRLFPSLGDPPLVLTSAKSAALIVMFVQESRLIIVAISPQIIRKKLERVNQAFALRSAAFEDKLNSKNKDLQEFQWMLGAVPSSWHVNSDADVSKPFQVLDRSDLRDFGSKEEITIIEQLAKGSDQVVAVKLPSNGFFRRDVFGATSISNINLKLFLKKSAIINIQNSFTTVIQESIILIACASLFVSLYLLSANEKKKLIALARQWMESLPARNAIPIELVHPTSQLAHDLSVCVNRAEKMLLAWRNESYFSKYLGRQSACLIGTGLENVNFEHIWKDTLWKNYNFELSQSSNCDLLTWTIGAQKGFAEVTSGEEENSLILFLLRPRGEHFAALAGQAFVTGLCHGQLFQQVDDAEKQQRSEFFVNNYYTTKESSSLSLLEMLQALESVPEEWRSQSQIFPSIMLWSVVIQKEQFFGTIWAHGSLNIRAHENVIMLDSYGERIISVRNQSLRFFADVPLSQIVNYLKSNTSTINENNENNENSTSNKNDQDDNSFTSENETGNVFNEDYQ